MAKVKGDGQLFVSLEDPFSNEVIRNGLRRFGLNTNRGGIEYKDEPIMGWNVTLRFLKELYKSQVFLPSLNFRVFIRLNANWQLFRLLEPGVMRKSRVNRLKS